MKTKKLLKIVKDYCSNRTTCSNCVFENCAFSKIPEEWDLDKMEGMIKYAKNAKKDC